MKFSLIIPVAPERECEIINSLKKLSIPKHNYEIIIERGTNPSLNRNRGAKKARGEILYFADDDALLDKDILNNAWDIFSDNPEIDIAGGPQLTPEDDGYIAKACGEALASPFGTMGMSKRYRRGKADYDADENSLTSANMFVRSKAFDKIGGFNERLFPGEDPEFLSRAKRKGHKIAYSPKLIIYHRRRATLVKFAQQMYSYGKSRIKKESYESSGNKMFYIPMLFSAYILALLFLNIMGMFYAPLFIPLLFYLGMAFTASGIATENYKKLLPNLIVLPIIFFIMHFMYGLGMMESWLEKNGEKSELSKYKVH